MLKFHYRQRTVMKTEGLYISFSPNGTIKRHLSTKSGEVPLPDTTIADELIQLSEQNHVHLYQAIKDIWALAGMVSVKLFAEIDFICSLNDYLNSLCEENLIRHTLLLTQLEDQKHSHAHNLCDAAMQIADHLSQSMAADLTVFRVLDALSNGQPIHPDDEYFTLSKSTATVTFTFDKTLTAEYLFRSEEQYYIFLLQHFLLSNPKVAVCQYCGRFFIPKTRKKTLYCDRIIRDRKTCKQIAPHMTHRERTASSRVLTEYNRVKDMLLHRLDRTCEDKRSSPIDLTYADFCNWQKAVSDARGRFLAGEITEEEALRIIHVPTIQNLRKSALQDMR